MSILSLQLLPWVVAGVERAQCRLAEHQEPRALAGHLVRVRIRVRVRIAVALGEPSAWFTVGLQVGLQGLQGRITGWASPAPGLR